MAAFRKCQTFEMKNVFHESFREHIEKRTGALHDASGLQCRHCGDVSAK